MSERSAESDVRPAGHVFSICGNCGEAWPSADPPIACVRCGKSPVNTTVRCPGCEKCGPRVLPPGTGGCVCPPGSPLHFDKCPLPPGGPDA